MIIRISSGFNRGRAKLSTVIALVIILGLLVHGLVGFLSRGGMPGAVSLSEIESMSDIDFPAQTKLVQSYTNAGHWQTYAKFQMKPADIKPFLNSLPQRNDISTIDRIDGLDSSSHGFDADWWVPGSPKKYVAIAVEPNGHIRSSILIHLDDTAKAEIFMYSAR